MKGNMKMRLLSAGMALLLLAAAFPAMGLGAEGTEVPQPGVPVSREDEAAAGEELSGSGNDGDEENEPADDEDEEAAEGEDEDEEAAKGEDEDEESAEGEGEDEEAADGEDEDEGAADGEDEDEEAAEGGDEDEEAAEGGDEDEEAADGGDEDEEAADGEDEDEGAADVEDESGSEGAAAPGGIQSGSITADGSIQDWDAAGITSVPPGSGDNSKDVNVTGVRVAQKADGTVYLCLEGIGNAWTNLDWVSFTITQNGTTSVVPVAWLDSGYRYVCDANGNSEAPFVMELTIPAGYFDDPNFIISFNGCNFPAGTIPMLDGVEQEKDPAPPTYDGIEIDERFDDWDAVTKYPADDPNNCIDKAAMIFDGGSVYIYIHEVNGGYASSAGSHSNGQFAITTDLGRTLVFQLTADGGILGIEGAKAVHVGSQWEIMIPADALPDYLETLSFGLYLGDPFVTDVADRDGGGGDAGSSGGIKTDGDFGDWNGYPHQTIEYATPGTPEQRVDSEGALYVEGSTLYGHVETTMLAHLAAEGRDFLAGITIAFNGDRGFKELPKDGNFYPRVVIRTEDGGYVTVNEYFDLHEGSELPVGEYTLYICDTRTSGEDVIFGTMKLKVDGIRDEFEFDLDLELVAAYIGCSVSDLDMIEAQFGRLGPQWLTVGGTSSGPWLGIALCAASPAALLWVRRRRGMAAA